MNITNETLLKIIPEIRIYLCPQDGSQERIEHYISSAVPRIGDMICVQHWTCEVYRVEWTIIKGKVHADVFCDGSKCMMLKEEIS